MVGKSDFSLKIEDRPRAHPTSKGRGPAPRSDLDAGLCDPRPPVVHSAPPQRLRPGRVAPGRLGSSPSDAHNVLHLHEVGRRGPLWGCRLLGTWLGRTPQ